MTAIRALHDPALSARIVARRALRYGTPVQDASEPQPFVRAASGGIVWRRARIMAR